MRLYSGPLSLFSRKVEIALYEKGLEFERIEVEFTQDRGYQPRHPDVLAANPKGQVPVLVDGDLTLFDSTVILEYLEDRHPQPPLYPSDPADKARCRLAELHGDEILLGEVARLMYRTEKPRADPEEQRKRQEDGQRGMDGIARHYDALEQRLGGADYFCGAFSAADIGLFTTTHYALRLNGPGLESHPALAAWYRRIAARPSVERVTAEIAEADRRLSWPLSA